VKEIIVSKNIIDYFLKLILNFFEFFAFLTINQNVDVHNYICM
jgi:hypothetical protein